MSARIMRQVADLASAIEPDQSVVFRWITDSKIDSLSGRTPFEAVMDGEGALVLSFLDNVLQEGRAVVTRTYSNASRC